MNALNAEQNDGSSSTNHLHSSGILLQLLPYDVHCANPQATSLGPDTVPQAPAPLCDATPFSPIPPDSYGNQ